MIGQALRKLVDIVNNKISLPLWWLSLKLSHLGSIEGIAICDFVAVINQSSKKEFLDVTRQAMELVKSVDPRRYRRLNRCLHYIVNRPLLSRGQFGRTLKICSVDYSRNFRSPYALRNVREFAGTLIHEATHGLLFEKGIPYNEKTRERVERLCHLESFRFALRFEPGYADISPGPFNLAPHKQNWDRSFHARWTASRRRDQEVFRKLKPSNLKSARDYNIRGLTYAEKGG